MHSFAKQQSCRSWNSYLFGAVLVTLGLLPQFSFGQANPIKPTPLASGPTVTGSVLLPNKMAAGDANVFLLANPENSFRLPTDPMRTVTDAAGKFTFDSVPPHGYRIWAETQEFTTLERKLSGVQLLVAESASGPVDPIRLELHAGCGYDVTVVERSSRTPIADAKISFGWTDIVREYSTATDGVAKIRQLAMADWYFVVQADGYATQFLKTTQQELGTVLPLEFELRPGGELVGTVRDGDGTPVGDATVTLSSAELSMAPSYGRVTTNADGGYQFKGLPLGKSLRLAANKDDYERASLECSVVQVDAPVHTDVTMRRLSYGGDIQVTVVDLDDKPISGAELLNRGNSTADVRNATTNENGVAVIQNVYTGFRGCNVAVRADGFVPQLLAVQPGTVDSPTQWRVQLEPGLTLKGRVIDAEGSPSQGVRVYYNGGEQGFNDLGGLVKTDVKGEFEIRGLKDPTSITVYTPPQFAPIRNMPVSVEMDEFLEIQMVPAASIRIRAVDANTGKPIPTFNVRLGFCEEREAGDPESSGIPATLIQQGVNVLGTQEEFRLEGQAPGAVYKAIVSAAGYEPTTLARAVATADNIDAMTAELQPMREEDYQMVAGTLLDADQNPISGASVRLLLGSEIPIPSKNGGGQMEGWRFYHWDLLSRDDIENRDKCVQLLKAVSDENGRFEFPNVKRFTPWMELFYFGRDLMPQRYSNLRNYTDESLANLKPIAEHPASLVVKLVGDRGKEAHSIGISGEEYISGPNSVALAFGSESKELDESRVAEFSNLPSGTYQISVTAKPTPLSGTSGIVFPIIASKKISIVAGEKHEVNFD